MYKEEYKNKNTNHKNNKVRDLKIDMYQLYKEIKFLNRNLNRVEKDLEYKFRKLEVLIDDITNDNSKNKNADLMIMERLENIADFLRNNYNVVVEEREIFTLNPHDD